MSSVCLFAESSLGSIRFDYNIYKKSVGTVSSVYFVDTNGDRVEQIAIDMNKKASQPQIYFVQENNLKATDPTRRVKLNFTTFKPSDGKNAGFSGKYTVTLWRLTDFTNRTSKLNNAKDKDKVVSGDVSLDWGLNNSDSQNGEPIACYYALAFSNFTPSNISGTADDFPPGRFSATITVELQGN